MRETEFIDQNKEKWLELERLGASKKKDPEKLSELFIEATNDLSYSKSYFPSRSIRVYLNNLALAVHSNVYRTRKSTWARVSKLWLEQIPRAYYEARKTVLLSFIIFFVGVFIGVFSSHQDPGFIGLMLSDGYIEMTLENIEEGRPFGVYASDSHMDLFAFHYMFYEHGLLGDSLITVWMHGMPEISAIILAGAAGMELGRGLIFPKSYTRKESFLIGAKKGVLMILGLIPVFLFAGFIEGFATRYTGLPDFIRIMFILVCAGFMLTYFVIMPRIRYRGKFNQSVAEDEIPDSSAHNFKLSAIKKHSEVFSDTFALYSSKFSSFILPAFGIALLYVLSLFILLGDDFLGHFTTLYVPNLGDFFTAMARAFIKVDQLYELMTFPILLILNAAIIGVIALLSLRHLQRFFSTKNTYVKASSSIVALGWVMAVSLIIHLVFFLPSPLSLVLTIGIAPFFLFAVGLAIVPESEQFSLLERYKMAVRHGYVKLLGIVLALFCCSSLFMLFFNSGLTDYLFQTLLGGIRMEKSTYENLMVIINLVLTTWSLLMVIPLFVFASYFFFWSSVEIETAVKLKSDIARIGIRDKAYGILREEN